MLQDLIALCLNTAVKDKMLSIAFPTIGCGGLKFDPATVATCFKAAMTDTNAALTVRSNFTERCLHCFSIVTHCIISISIEVAELLQG